MATSPAVAAKPAAAPVPQAPADPLTGYYRAVRQMNLQLAKDRYKQGFKVRTQEYIRGRGTLAIVDEEICMGCTHCFDNCAFESIGMVDRKFALPEYSYTSRKAIIIEENCVGCEKCAIVCPVDAITMVTKHGFEVKDGRVVSTTPVAPPAPRPPPATPMTARPTTAAPAPKPAAPVTVVKPAATPPTTEAPAPKPPPKPEPKAEAKSDEKPEEESAESSEEPAEEETSDEETDG
ncbi:MAG TPA: 4Fe-4S dicluster-binding protein [Thermoplasmata archaeon]|nr:4Fe-4S dicluster-binding protein [Thermoplasmata archaeon]